MALNGDERTSTYQHAWQRSGGFARCFVDIACEKGAALVERKTAKDANEAGVKQETFIDTTSHEVRNPVLVMLHCKEDTDQAMRDQNNFDIPSILTAIETINGDVDMNVSKAANQKPQKRATALEAHDQKVERGGG